MSAAASSEHAAANKVELKINADASAEPTAVNPPELQVTTAASAAAANAATSSAEHDELEAQLAAAQKRLLAAQDEVEQLQVIACQKLSSHFNVAPFLTHYQPINFACCSCDSENHLRTATAR